MASGTWGDPNVYTKAETDAAIQQSAATVLGGLHVWHGMITVTFNNGDSGALYTPSITGGVVGENKTVHVTAAGVGFVCTGIGVASNKNQVILYANGSITGDFSCSIMIFFTD